ncbi:MAG TPA: ABC transporter permease [Firmicutes bacterium]|nr:ABC transporter permease [Bacillota bacterium]
MDLLYKAWNIVSENPEVFLGAIRDHLLLLVFTPVLLAIIVAIPLGILSARYKKLGKIVLNFAGMIQTIPSLALLVIMLALGMGLGYRPAITGLFLYSLLPILRNTYTGITNVDPFLKEAAIGMGMTNMQRLRMVELPLSLSVIMAGIRTATVICIGTGVLAAYIGAGGLGPYIVRGLALYQNQLLILGAVPAAIMALLADIILGKLEYMLTPRGLRE